MTERRKFKPKTAAREIAMPAKPESNQRKKMVIRSATAEDYRKRAYETIGTFYRFENGKLKP